MNLNRFFFIFLMWNMLNYYKIDDIIALKLEGTSINIYIKEQKFIQCKKIFILNNASTIKETLSSNSIDEAYANVDAHNFIKNELISPETEFWAHCSNIQAWVENDYDTHLLHSNLAFPLLKILSSYGIPKAQKMFKIEILKRILEGFIPTVNYLLNEGYSSFLNESEILSCFLESNSNLYKNIAELIDDTSYTQKYIFPLLSNLTLMGDKLAGLILREETLKRLETGKLEDLLYFIHNFEIFESIIGRNIFKIEWFEKNPAFLKYISDMLQYVDFNKNYPNSYRKFPFRLITILYEMGFSEEENLLVVELTEFLTVPNKILAEFLVSELYIDYFPKRIRDRLLESRSVIRPGI